MVVTIHQPEHLPWLGFFHKVLESDLVVFLDNVQFRKNYFQNRNRVRTKEGWTWVTVPVSHRSTSLIMEVSPAGDRSWVEKWWKTLYQCYSRAPYFDDCFPAIREVLEKERESLSELNIALIEVLSSLMGIGLKYRRASDIAEGKGSELLLEICRRTEAKAYLSGISGREYLDRALFARENIWVLYQEFHHPVYSQVYEPFIPCMSAVDLLFNHGPRSKDIIMGKGVEVMKEVFL